MNYLKISLRVILSFSPVFLPGCVSVLSVPEETLPEPPAEISDAAKLGESVLFVPSVGEIVSRDSAEVDSIKWITVEPENISSAMILPKVEIRDRVISPIISPGYYGFNNIDSRISGIGLKPEQLVIAETDSTIETSPINKAANGLNNEPVETMSALLKNDVPEDVKEDPAVTEQEIKVLVSDKLKITLPGNGWIYLPDKENSTLNYSGRQFSDENTVYSFKPEEEGEFVLNFQFQDLIKNIYTKEKVHLIVYSKLSESDSKVAPMDISVEKPEIPLPADLNALLKDYLSTKNVEGLFNMVPDLVRSTDPEVRSLLPETAEFLYNSSRFVPSALILETLVMDKNYTASKDRFLYLLGKTYEADSPIRNELIAADYYKQLLDTYSASIYWDESRDRYRFLKRRYIDIR